MARSVHDLLTNRASRKRTAIDDEIEPGTGFGRHSHLEMEIVTHVRQGAVTREDSLGNVVRTVAGDLQVMSAGTGVSHCEHIRDEDASSPSRSGCFTVIAVGTPVGQPQIPEGGSGRRPDERTSSEDPKAVAAYWRLVGETVFGKEPNRDRCEKAYER
jgi:hypothetical protein